MSDKEYDFVVKMLKGWQKRLMIYFFIGFFGGIVVTLLLGIIQNAL